MRWGYGGRETRQERREKRVRERKGESENLYILEKEDK